MMTPLQRDEVTSTASETPLPMPVLVSQVDLGRFSFDPLTLAMFPLLDGEHTTAQIAQLLGAVLDDIMDRLNALRQANIVKWASPPSPSASATATKTASATDSTLSTGELALQALGEERPGRQNLFHADHCAILPGLAAQLIEVESEQSFTGALIFSRESDHITLHFQEGLPLGIQSTISRHEMGRMLHAMGRINTETADMYDHLLQSGKARHSIEALQKAGITDRAQLARMIYDRGRAILDEVNRWSGGTCTRRSQIMFPRNLPRCSLLPMAPTASDAVERPQTKAPSRWREERLTRDEEQFLVEHQSRYIAVDREKAQELHALDLNNKEKEWVRHIIEKPVQVSFAFSISPLFRVTSQRLMHQLIARGVFVLHEFNPQGSAAIPLEKLSAHLTQLKLANPYQVLSAHATSTEAEIERYFQRALATFDLNNFTQADKEQRQTIIDIQNVIQGARDELMQPERRRVRRAELWDATQLETFFDIQLKKAEIALELRRDGALALQLSLSALELRPNHPGALSIRSRAQQLVLFKRSGVVTN